MDDRALKVLIVDDSAGFREILREGVLSRFPLAQISEAEDWEAGLRLARARAPDLAIVDVSLPGGSGLDLARRLKTAAPGASVIVCTMHDLPEYREAARLSGAAFWAKDCLCVGDFAALVAGVR